MLDLSQIGKLITSSFCGFFVPKNTNAVGKKIRKAIYALGLISHHGILHAVRHGNRKRG